jgi:peptidoglycan/xylan/chitin deacetylase (PgdA/CDA1 family)
MKTMSRRDIAREIMNTHSLLPEGCVPKLLRPPGGCCSDGVRQVAQARQLAIISWSVDPRDWESRNKEKIVSAVMADIRPGSIILLHDIYQPSVEAALEIVDRLQAKGYWFVTVEELLRLYGIAPQPGVMYRSGK